MPFVTPLELEYVGVDRYRVTADLVYRGATDTLTVPAGAISDLASIPRVVRWLLPQDGDWTAAAILHDTGCDALNAGRPWLSSRDTDAVFRRCAREGGTPVLARWLLWTGVRWGAVTNRHRRPGIGRDLPLMLLLSLLALPLVAPASVMVALGLAVYVLAETAVTGATAAAARVRRSRVRRGVTP